MIIYNSKMLIEIMFKSIYESLLQINRIIKYLWTIIMDILFI